MSEREMMAMLEMMGGTLGSFIGPIVATLLSGVILTYCIRWFIFVKAGEKGWKALIPVYSDYITYKIAWDGRLYIALLVGTVASSLLGSIFGLINAGLGMFVSIVLSTVVASAKAIASLIMKFKLAHAFGKNDYFFVGLYFLNNVFTAILAFGECEYKGPQQDGVRIPKFIENFGRKNDMAGYPPMQPMMSRPMPQPQQPVAPQQYPQQYQQPMNTGSYPVVQPQQQYQQPYNTGSYAPVQQYQDPYRQQ